MVKFESFPILLGLVLVLTLVGAPTKADGPVCRQAEKFSRASFPEGFLWGTATAAFQVNLLHFYQKLLVLCFFLFFLLPDFFYYDRLKELLMKVVEVQACGTLTLRNTHVYFSHSPIYKCLYIV